MQDLIESFQNFRLFKPKEVIFLRQSKSAAGRRSSSQPAVKQRDNNLVPNRDRKPAVLGNTSVYSPPLESTKSRRSQHRRPPAEPEPDSPRFSSPSCSSPREPVVNLVSVEARPRARYATRAPPRAITTHFSQDKDSFANLELRPNLPRQQAKGASTRQRYHTYRNDRGKRSRIKPSAKNHRPRAPPAKAPRPPFLLRKTRGGKLQVTRGGNLRVRRRKEPRDRERLDEWHEERHGRRLRDTGWVRRASGMLLDRWLEHIGVLGR